jgi:hypothetical protein
VACDATTTEPPVEPTREQAEAEARPTTAAPAAPPPPGSPEIGVEINFVGIAPLHQGFFGDPKARSALGRSLAGQVSNPAKLAIAFDSQEHLGTIQLELAPDGIYTPITHQGDTIQLSDLAPITSPLASYRSSLASRFDVRIESFRVRLFSVRGLHSCLFDITGEAPPDGRTLSPCVHIDGEEHCGQPGPAGVTFSPEVARDVATCLDLD